MVLGRLGTRTGTDPAAAAEAWKVAEPSGEAQRVLICAAGLAEAAWTRDDPDDVRRRVDAVWDARGRARRPVVPRRAALVAALRGRAPRGAAARRRTVRPHGGRRRGRGRRASWDAIGNPFWAALARAASDDPDDLRAAATGLEALGATATHAAVVRDLRRRRHPGAPRTSRGQPRQPRRPHRTRDGGPATRSPRACPTPQIAARFVLSEKTVAHHVSAVLRKLQEPSRSRAVATARRTGLIDTA